MVSVITAQISSTARFFLSFSPSLTPSLFSSFSLSLSLSLFSLPCVCVLPATPPSYFLHHPFFAPHSTCCEHDQKNTGGRALNHSIVVRGYLLLRGVTLPPYQPLEDASPRRQSEIMNLLSTMMRCLSKVKVKVCVCVCVCDASMEGWR